MSDGGPQFYSAEFQRFAKEWGFDHNMSSPYYPQYNGLAENGVKVVKRLLIKAACRERRRSLPSDASVQRCTLGQRQITSRIVDGTETEDTIAFHKIQRIEATEENNKMQ